jgi:hypothetical protein
MARILSNETVDGVSLNTKVERKATCIRIHLDPRTPMRMAFEYSDNTLQTLTVPGQPPATDVLSVVPVGELDVTAAEMAAMPCFAETYAQLKAMADAKSAAQWPPEPAPSEVPQP